MVYENEWECRMKRNDKKPDSFVKVGDIIKDVLRTQRRYADAKMVRVWDVWPSAVGDRISGNTEPAMFKGGQLIVNASSSAWVQQLWLLKDDIVAKVNHGLGEDLVTEIKFRIGPV
jgi:predicted nucleic acid-binding Zn ribbon protein